MSLNPTELCKICKGEHFTFEGAGNADVHFQCTQNSCSLVLRNEQEYFQLMHMFIFTNKFFPFMPIAKNY